LSQCCVTLPHASSASALPQSTSQTVNPLMRVSTMLLRSEEIVWLGMTNGMTMIFQLPRQLLVPCLPSERHTHAVNGLAMQPAYPVTIWTASTDGMRVWMADPQEGGLLLDRLHVRGWLELRGAAHRRAKAVWVTLENAKLHWSADKVAGAAQQEVDIRSEIRQLSLDNDDVLRIEYDRPGTTGPATLTFSAAASHRDGDSPSVSRWYRLLMLARAAQPGQFILMPLDDRQLSCPVTTLQAGDHGSVWAAADDLSLSEWSLATAHETHGLSHSYTITHLRRISLNVDLPARFRCITALFRIFARAFLVGIGNTLFRLGVNETAPTPLVVLDDRITAVAVVETAPPTFLSPSAATLAGGRRIWAADAQGRLIEIALDEESGMTASQTQIDCLAPGTGFLESLAQVSPRLVWGGDKFGNIYAWDIQARVRVAWPPSEIAHRRPVTALISSYQLTRDPHQAPLVISGSFDQSLVIYQ
jgi:hypothetical protein